MKRKVIYFNTFTGFPYFWKTAALTELAKRQKEGLRIDDLKRAMVAIYTSNSYSIVNSRLETVSLYYWASSAQMAQLGITQFYTFH